MQRMPQFLPFLAHWFQVDFVLFFDPVLSFFPFFSSFLFTQKLWVVESFALDLPFPQFPFKLIADALFLLENSFPRQGSKVSSPTNFFF